LRTSAALLASFLTPLVVWMVVIWLRYDTQTLVAWCFSYVTFVAKHGAAVSLRGLPTYSGWAFDPAWDNQTFLSGGWEYVRTYLIPLGVAALALAVHTTLRLFGVVRPSRRATVFLLATVVALGIEFIWFFAFDPTQWGRHLMPALYVAIALGAYCLADIRRNTTTRRWQRIAWAVAVLAVSIASVRYVADYVEFNRWHASYSRSCRGLGVLRPPCSQNDAIKLIAEWTRELCHTERNPFDPAEPCMSNERARFLARAVAVLEHPDRTGPEVHAAMYTIIVLQNYNYHRRREFLEDFLPLVCGKSAGVLYERLRDGGMDTGQWIEECPAPGAPKAQRFVTRAA
jgi:hypothetical protein